MPWKPTTAQWQVLGDEKLKKIALELLDTHKNTSIDWTVKESGASWGIPL